MQLVALLKQDVPSAGVRVIMTSCFFGGASEEHEEHAAASLGREKAVGKAMGKAIVPRSLSLSVSVHAGRQHACRSGDYFCCGD